MGTTGRLFCRARGFGRRVMFVSDHMVWSETIERSIRVIEDAPFLSEEEKRNILYNNAAQFLRLSDGGRNNLKCDYRSCRLITNIFKLERIWEKLI